jgi:protein-ribulosamine 3-kinase
LEPAAEFGIIAAAIADRTGNPFIPRSVLPVGGGSIHRAWRLSDGGRRYFVKTNDPAAAPMFAAEAQGLQALSAAAAVRIPTFVTAGKDAARRPFWCSSISTWPASTRREAHDSAKRWRGCIASGATPSAGHGQLHRQPRHSRTPPTTDWPHFFGERRLRPQLGLAQQNGMDKALVAKGEAVIERIGGLFIDYRPAPSLLHGDLWSGNAAQTADGTPVIFDPACYYGDRETDIAMAELFGGFPTSFYAAYRSAWPLDSGYEARKPLYNLYHILNHFNLFGGAYLGQAQRMIEAC